MGEVETRPIQVWLDADLWAEFEVMKREYRRNTSDMVRWLIEKEATARRAASLTSQPTPQAD